MMKVIIEIESNEAFMFMSKRGVKHYHPNRDVIEECWRLQSSVRTWDLHDVYSKEGNSYASPMAKLG